MSSFSEELLKAAYDHYISTGDRTYITLPLNDTYLANVCNASQTLYDAGYIDNLSDNLVYPVSFNIAMKPDQLSFDITAAGIEKVRSRR